MPTAHTTRTPTGDWTENDYTILGRIEQSLADGLALKRWWERTDKRRPYAEQFELTRSFNHSASSYGFFDEATLDGRRVPVMGILEEIQYDQTKGAASARVSDELREFVMRYFLRISDFRQPSAYVDSARRGSEAVVRGLTWCDNRQARRAGFGYSQQYYKRCDTGEVGKFDAADAFSIVDLREIGDIYDWIVMKVELFDFTLGLQPFGEHSPRLVVPLSEKSYLVLTRDFIVNQDRPESGVLRECGFGYAFIRDPSADGLIAYGPGQFDVAFKLIRFCMLESGETRVQMVFVANRPENILNVSLDPITWGVRAVDWLSCGRASRMLGVVEEDGLAPLGKVRFDPLTASIALVNTLTAGRAAEELCISRTTLEKYFLLQHFQQHYQMLVGSLLTWRMIADWRDPDALPDWVRTGVSS